MSRSLAGRTLSWPGGAFRAGPAIPGAPMPTFSIFIDDDRYSTPTLHFVVDDDVAAARTFAIKYLLQSPHHRAVRIDVEGAEIFATVRRDLAPGAPTA